MTVVPAAVIATLLLVPSTSGAMSIKAAGEQYLKDVAPAEAALKTFYAEEIAWTNSTPDAEGEQQAASVLAALETLRKNLQSQTWPQFVEGGVQYIRWDISSLQEDLSWIDGNSTLGNGTFQYTFSNDSKTLDSDAFYLRRDLGLPSSRAL
jgi:hypothetical protein